MIEELATPKAYHLTIRDGVEAVEHMIQNLRGVCPECGLVISNDTLDGYTRTVLYEVREPQLLEGRHQLTCWLGEWLRNAKRITAPVHQAPAMTS